LVVDHRALVFFEPHQRSISPRPNYCMTIGWPSVMPTLIDVLARAFVGGKKHHVR
ncbi:uncharacterized protein METZ01_LOCUS418337, partial [marine metagenome]